ncbi:hypothetical protein GHO45_27190, partial [Pseudomonas sp. FSL R10-0765]|nr:hypothetical protein [Pseudomonas sp. FSL R10-0765]
MNAPRISRPHEPGLFARAPNLERYRVAAGGLTLIAMQPGDSLQVIDLEGQQSCELLALNAQGASALSDWGLSASAANTYLRTRLSEPTLQARRITQALGKRAIEANNLPHPALLWGTDSPAGHQQQWVAEAERLVLIAAFASVVMAWAKELDYDPART